MTDEERLQKLESAPYALTKPERAQLTKLLKARRGNQMTAKFEIRRNHRGSWTIYRNNHRWSSCDFTSRRLAEIHLKNNGHSEG